MVKMRQGLGALALWWGVASSAGADPRPELPAPEASAESVLSVVGLGPLRVGERAALEVHVRLPEQAAESLLLSTDAEGAAVDVVRGRLMRDDAQDAGARPLVFRVPVVARGEGQSVVRVRVDGYVCSPLCESVAFDARAVVEVRRAEE